MKTQRIPVSPVFFLVICFLVFPAIVAAVETMVYQTNFDVLAIGPTLPDPGDPNQDGWFLVVAGGSGYGEIQNTIAHTGNALHEYASMDAGPGSQTIDQRKVNPPDLSIIPVVTLQVDFYAHSSDLNTSNGYAAGLTVNGGPHPGFEIIGLSLASGNGMLKSERGVDVTVSAFNGIDNNYAVPLTVGQGLDWDTWHSLALAIHQTDDHYVSLTVDGETQDLSGYALPRSPDQGVWKRGQQMEAFVAQVISSGELTDDEVFWDNLSLSGKCDLKADLTGDCKVDLEDLAVLASEWLCGT